MKALMSKKLKEAINKPLYEEQYRSAFASPDTLSCMISRETNLELPQEMNDWKRVLITSANNGNHAPNNWLRNDGRKCSHKEMHDSMFHHLAKSFSGEIIDKDDNLEHILKLATRALMYYTRLKRGLKHPDDK